MRAVYYSASVTTQTGGDTTADGEPCEPGRGYTEQSGHWSPDRDYWTVHPSRADVDPDTYPDDSPLPPARWLADQITERLGNLDHIDGHTFTSARTAIEPGRLTGPAADKPGAVAGTHTFLGDAFAAQRLRTAPVGIRTLTAAAHAYGFTAAELAETATLLGRGDPATGRS
ncbi:hypothetical protein [Asanoa iriomotensis]|uniref:Uncharacterized protein n=1 Tax=Asanoa iriomotensis TaxID=234613 RepID=A0ABQ4CFG7_9ACTN|nr:hypothetical protein [Asanoa iriomotensis]GIF61499.1 hypothetical protein Air01nite_75940 [Asanoa iriomotensis]